MTDTTKQDAELIGLALKHKSSILHRPELYYTSIPHTGIVGICGRTGNYSIGELIDIWDNVKGAYLRCPTCLRPAPYIRFVATFGTRRTVFICPHCQEEHTEIGYYKENLFSPIHDVRKAYTEGLPQGLDWYTTFRDEMIRLDVTGDPTFDTPRLQQPIFPASMQITLNLNKHQ